MLYGCVVCRNRDEYDVRTAQGFVIDGKGINVVFGVRFERFLDFSGLLEGILAQDHFGRVAHPSVDLYVVDPTFRYFLQNGRIRIGRIDAAVDLCDKMAVVIVRFDKNVDVETFGRNDLYVEFCVDCLGCQVVSVFFEIGVSLSIVMGSTPYA